MMRSLAKLQASADQRFAEQPELRQAYIDRHLDASDHVTDTHYEITPAAFAQLRDDITAEFGPRPRLQAAPAPAEERRVSLAEGMKRIGRGIKGLTKNALHLDQAEKDLQTARLLICDNCPESVPIDKSVESRSCGKLLKSNGKTCGCILGQKTRIASERCPQEKW